MSAMANEGKKRGRLPLWIMVAVFAAPVIAAWFFYLNPEYLPSGRTNKGELIAPVLPLPSELGLVTPTGAAFDRTALDGKWTLVYLAGGECGEDCLDRLVAIRQIRLAVGEGLLSVERLLIMTDPAAHELAAKLGADLRGMRVALTDAAGGERLLELLREGAAALDRIYILDPMGNLMMRYARGAPTKDTLEDMERLLEASKNWIEGSSYGHK